VLIKCCWLPLLAGEGQDPSKSSSGRETGPWHVILGFHISSVFWASQRSIQEQSEVKIMLRKEKWLSLRNPIQLDSTQSDSVRTTSLQSWARYNLNHKWVSISSYAKWVQRVLTCLSLLELIMCVCLCVHL
jgi:hypothetical protein